MRQSTPSLIEHYPTACAHGWLTQNRRLTPCLTAALIVGGLSALLGEWLGFNITGHKVNDPIMIVLSLSTLLRGLLYFNWPRLFIPLIYAVLLGIAAGAAARWLAARAQARLTSPEAARVALLASLVSVAPIWLQEVASLQSLLWYAAATYLSVLLAQLVARRAGS